MTGHLGTSTTSSFRGFLAVAAASAAVATATVGAAPEASATCASFFGVGNGNGCTSTFGNIAIAIGTGAEASAKGFLSSALAVGPDAEATAVGVLNAAIAAGMTGGAQNTVALAGYSTSDFLNVAISLGNDSEALAQESPSNVGTMAINLGQSGYVISGGTFSTAVSIGGNKPYIDNKVVANGVFDGALNLFGNHNDVVAVPGPFAIAVNIFQSNATVTKQGPGINININNGVVIGGASATAAATPKAGSARHAINSVVAKHTTRN